MDRSAFNEIPIDAYTSRPYEVYNSVAEALLAGARFWSARGVGASGTRIDLVGIDEPPTTLGAGFGATGEFAGLDHSADRPRVFA